MILDAEMFEAGMHAKECRSLQSFSDKLYDQTGFGLTAPEFAFFQTLLLSFSCLEVCEKILALRKQVETGQGRNLPEIPKEPQAEEESARQREGIEEKPAADYCKCYPMI